MICSKLDKLKNDRRDACFALEEALATSRGTSEARVEAVLKREQAIKTQTCSGCDRSDSLWIGSDGYCKECAAAVKRMLAFKSYIKNEWPKERRISRFLEDYQMVPNLPYALRGCMPREEIVRRIKCLLHATAALEDFNRKSDSKKGTA